MKNLYKNDNMDSNEEEETDNESRDDESRDEFKFKFAIRGKEGEVASDGKDHNNEEYERNIRTIQTRALWTRIEMQRTELLRKEETENEMKNIIDSLTKEREEKKEITRELNREVESRNKLIESITATNKSLRTEGEKKQQLYRDV